MQRNPVLIVREYLQPGEPAQVRRNALTALAILGDPEGWKAMTNAALTDADASVREHAEVELTSMPPAVAADAIVPVLDCLVEPAKREAAYALLARLRNRGMVFRMPRLPFRTRLWLAKSMNDHLYPTRGVAFHVRTWKGALLGAVAAWVMLLLFCGVVLDIHVEVSSALAYLFIALVFTTVVVIPATAFTSPARYYTDIGGGAALDIGIAVAVAFAFAVVILISWSVPAEGSTLRPWLFLLLGPLTVAAVRAGTLSVFGLLRTPWQNLILQIVVGGACGVAVADVALFTSSGDNQFLNEGWYVMALIACGLAGAYAWIDRQSLPHPVVSRKAAAAGLSLAAIPVLLLPILLTIPPAVSLPEHLTDVSADVAFSKIASEMSWAKIHERITATVPQVPKPTEPSGTSVH